MPRSPLDAFRAFGPKLLGLSLVGGLVLAGVLLPFTGALGFLTKSSISKFENQSCDLGDSEPSQTTTIKGADGTVLAKIFVQNRTLIPNDQIPDSLKKAIVAIEDRRFYDHHGVDPKGTLRALISDVFKGGETQQGGSTLTQQYIKQARLYSAATKEDQNKAVERSASRKLSEARCALEIEKKLSKDEILGRYLNIANFGTSAYGVGTAATTYFNTTADKLTVAQSALLAAIVNAPGTLNPFTGAEAAKARRSAVLHDMVELKYITQQEADKANKERLLPPGQKPTRSANGCANANKTIPNAGFFCDYVTTYLSEHANLSLADLQRGGFVIDTTIDPKIQTAAQAAVDAHVGRDRKATAVMDIVDPATGAVKAMAVGRNYGVDAKKNETVLPLATKAVTGSGSTYKLFTTIAALEDQMPTRGETITTPDNTYTPTNCGVKEAKTVTNAGHYDATLNLETAFYQSSNTFFTALIDQRFNCDLTKPVEAAVRLGLTPIQERQKSIIQNHEISFTLGPQETSPLELASAYGAIDNNGILCPAHPINKITRANGDVVPLQLPSCNQVVDPGIANTITQILRKDTDPRAPKSTAKAAALPGIQTAGKTGTSQDNAATWFVGYTSQYVASTALFNPDNPSAQLVDVPGFEGKALFGGTVAAKVFHDAFTTIMQGVTPLPFPPEDPKVVNGDLTQIPNVVGQDLQTATNMLQAAGFVAQVGEGKPSAQPVDTVAETSPSGYAKAGSTITLFPSLGQPSATPTPSVPPGFPEFPGFPFPSDQPTPDPSQSAGPQPGPPGRHRDPFPTPTP